jgi:ADP-ribose pyrophosphatase YjhB (NUDIX family)
VAEPSAGTRGGRRGRGSGRRARTETSAGGVVFRRDGPRIRFLLIRDPYDNWGLPKGHLEEGETAADAALREVREETGLAELVLQRELPRIDWYFRDRGQLIHKFCYFFLMESAGGEAEPQREEGISACVWEPLPRALDTLTYANAREVLRAAGKALGLDGAQPPAGGPPDAPPG